MANNAKRIAELEAELAQLRRGLGADAPTRDAGLVSRNQEEAEHNQKLVDDAVRRLREETPRTMVADYPDPVRPAHIQPADERNLPLPLQPEELRNEQTAAAGEAARAATNAGAAAANVPDNKRARTANDK